MDIASRAPNGRYKMRGKHYNLKKYFDLLGSTFLVGDRPCLKKKLIFL
jgi:hypothetical protein